MSVSIQNVTVTLSGRRVVTGVTAECPTHHLTAIVGPNGAGKTSLLRAVAGLVPFKGQVLIRQTPLASMPPYERARTIAYLPQAVATAWPVAVRDIVSLGRYPHGLAAPDRLGPEDAAAVAEALAACDATHLADLPVTSLSGGERARVALARTLATQASVLLADEPTAALDPYHQLSIMERLRQYAHAGMTTVVITHDLDLARRYADTVLVMAGGRLVAGGPPSVALSEQIMADVFRLQPEADAARRWGRVT